MQARVVKLQFCEADDCKFEAEGGAKHLLAIHHFVDVSRGNATAISYAWGALDRSNHVLGHFQNGEPIVMELGLDWTVPDLCTALHELCSGGEGGDSPPYVWIDQLCIVQSDPADVRAALARIPDIYRSFDVTILMPGGLCECQLEYLQQLRHLEGGEHDKDYYEGATLIRSPETTCQHSDDWYDRISSYPGPLSRCLNNMSLTQCFSRLWTRQELLYARKVKMVWTSKTPLRCVRKYLNADDIISEQDRIEPFPIDQLHPIPRASIRSQIDVAQNEDRDPSDTTDDLHLIVATARTEASYAWHNTVESIREWALYHQLHGDDNTIYWQQDTLRSIKSRFQHLICGDPISVHEKADQQELSIEARVQRFLTVLLQLRHSRRKATQARDYVLAVWVDCPCYTVPQAFKRMTFQDLFHDALYQLNRFQSYVFLSTIPAGLLKQSHDSALWAPEIYMASESVRHCESIYGAVILPIQSPIRIVEVAKDSAHKHNTVFYCNTYFNSVDTLSIVDVFAQTVCTWALDACLAVMGYEHEEIETGDFNNWKSSSTSQSSPELAKLSFSLCNFVSTVLDLCYEDEDLRRFMSTGSFRHNPDEMPEELGSDLYMAYNRAHDLSSTDICEVILRIACIALRIDPQIAQQHNLRLIINPGSDSVPSRFGLMRSSLDLESTDLYGTVYASNTGLGNTANSAMYELARVHSPGEDAAYEVVGVWVPSLDFPESALAGYIESSQEGGRII